jgi:hypothetical protein
MTLQIPPSEAVLNQVTGTVMTVGATLVHQT